MPSFKALALGFRARRDPAARAALVKAEFAIP
jgi:hypothetical protein